MIILRKKRSFFLLIFLLFFFVLAYFGKYLAKHSIKSLISHELQILMLHDHGFSTPKNLLGFNSLSSALYEIPFYFPQNILKSLILQIQDFPNRPKIEKIEININFKDYRKILDDRKRFLQQGYASNHQKVKAEIKYKEKKYKSSLRLKGDYSEHWGSSSRMSFRIDLKDETLFGFKSFSIHKSEARQFPYDQTFGKLNQKLGNLSPKQTFAHVFVNGQDWGVMNLEEHMSKEFLEKQKKKESLIFKFGNDLDSHYNHGNLNEYPNYRIGDDRLNLSIYQNNKYLKDIHNRLLLSYVHSKRLEIDSSSLFNIEKYAKSFALASIWGNWHALSSMNSRNYFNPYLLILEPIITDNGPPKELKLLEERDKKVLSRAYDPYDIIISSDLYKKKINQIFSDIKISAADAQKYIDFYQSYFPGDKKIFLSKLIKNINTIEKDPNFYLTLNPYQKKHAKIAIPSIKQANKFPVHIHARHFTNGNIEIYNLLPDDVKIKSINFQNLVLEKNIVLPGFKTGEYIPLILKTDILGLADQKINILTEYKGNTRKHLIDYTLISGPYLNPLTNFISSEENLLIKETQNKWLIKKGKWNVNQPITITGTLEIEPGAVINFSEGTYIIIKGQLIAKGNIKQTIKLYSDKTWKGIYVIGDGNKVSELDYVQIKNTTALADGLLKLSSGTNFYNSKIKITNSQIKNSKAEDAINIIESEFVFKNLSISNTFSDALDSDFSTGNIVNSSFFNVGGDAADFSGSEVTIENSKFNNIKDKAISAGEDSIVKLQNIKIDHVGVGVASKDGSNVNVSNLEVNNYKLHAVMSYIKKDFYNYPSLIGHGIKINPIKKNAFIAQEKSFMSLNSRIIDTEQIDVEDLYQNEVMKK